MKVLVVDLRLFITCKIRKVRDNIQIYSLESTQYSTNYPKVGRGCPFQEVDKACLRTILFPLCIYRHLRGEYVSVHSRLRARCVNVFRYEQEKRCLVLVFFEFPSMGVS